jgi:hypothetical protein
MLHSTDSGFMRCLLVSFWAKLQHLLHALSTRHLGKLTPALSAAAPAAVSIFPILQTHNSLHPASGNGAATGVPSQRSQLLMRRLSTMIRPMSMEWSDIGCSYNTSTGMRTVLKVRGFIGVAGAILLHAF